MMKVNFNDLLSVYDEEVKKNVKNKKKLFYFEKNKMEYLISIKRELENNTYDGGKYNVFVIRSPKVRVIMSQNLYDKVINHYVARYILMPKLSKYLMKENFATRKNMGTSAAIRKLLQDLEYFKKYDKTYILKLDLKKYFYTIDHEVLKQLLKNELNSEEYYLMCNIIDSTNKEYINEKIAKIEKEINQDLPKYEFGKGLPIGNMTSQFLAIFYLYKLHHYIKHNLHIKKFIVYMDDYILMHNDKKYLEYCKNEIINFLKEYKMQISTNKTFITSIKNGFNFLGYNFRIVNNKTIVKLSKSSKRAIIKGIKRNIYLYNNGLKSFESLFCSIETFKGSYLFVNKDKIKHLLERYWVTFTKAQNFENPNNVNNVNSDGNNNNDNVNNANGVRL